MNIGLFEKHARKRTQGRHLRGGGAIALASGAVGRRRRKLRSRLEATKSISTKSPIMMRITPYNSVISCGFPRRLRSSRNVFSRCWAVDGRPCISSLRIPIALLAALCWSGERVVGGVGGSATGNGIISDNPQQSRRSEVRERRGEGEVSVGCSPGEKGTTEVNGEYGSASSTVGGRNGKPPPLALCQSPFGKPDMVKMEGRRWWW